MDPRWRELRRATVLSTLLVTAVLLVTLLVIAWVTTPAEATLGPEVLAAGVVADSLTAPLLGTVREVAQQVIWVVAAAVTGFIGNAIRKRLGMATAATRTGRLLELGQIACVGAEQQHPKPGNGASAEEVAQVNQVRKAEATSTLLALAQQEGLPLVKPGAGPIVEAALGLKQKAL
jgi:hypothetical protein